MRLLCLYLLTINLAFADTLICYGAAWPYSGKYIDEDRDLQMHRFITSDGKTILFSFNMCRIVQ